MQIAQKNKKHQKNLFNAIITILFHNNNKLGNSALYLLLLATQAANAGGERIRKWRNQ